MNDADDPLRAQWQRERARDERRAPSFAAMSARARSLAARGGETQSPVALLRWLVPAAVAVLLALWLGRPEPEAEPDYSQRIAALLADLDAPAFAHSSLPSDLLPSAFPEP